jgi:GDP-L-fucose synthase
MKTILVTGGSGLVGSAFKDIQELYPNYSFIFISSSDVNLLEYELVLNCFKQSNPDIIIHLAANVGGLYKNMSNPVQMLENNLLINSNVLKAAHGANINKLIGVLSTCIFPDSLAQGIEPIDESMLHLGPPHTSNAPYAYAKRMLQVGCAAYSTQYSREYTCVIPTNIYGPNDNFNLEDSHVIPGLIHKCWLAKTNQTPFVICGTGKPLRQFIHSHDLARCILDLVSLDKIAPTIIISPDPSEEVSIGYIGELIAKEFDYSSMLIYDETKSDGQFKKTASNSLFRSLNPDYKFVTIESGIKSTVEWFKSAYPDIRK